MRRTYGLTPGQIGQLAGRSVAIQPWENSVAWAYPSIRWDPEPVLQSYSAYTPTLDQLDASFLSSDAAPARILQQAAAVVDGRYFFFEPPTTWVTMMCRYVQVDATGEWQVLRRVTNRCGTLRPIEQVTATFGQKIAVPRAPAHDDGRGALRQLAPVVRLHGVIHRAQAADLVDRHICRNLPIRYPHRGRPSSGTTQFDDGLRLGL